jgi:hypothetical protein
VLAVVVSVAATAGLTIPGRLSTPDAAITPLPKAPAQVAASVTQLQSRFVDRRNLRVWGSTTAPDGSSIVLRITADGMAADKLAVRAVAGRFSAKALVPTAMRSHPLRVSAAVAP